MSLIKENLINSSNYNRKCPYTMNPIGISIHNTYNDAPAKNEVSYMHSNNNQVSFHIAVDDIEAIQGLPLIEIVGVVVMAQVEMGIENIYL